MKLQATFSLFGSSWRFTYWLLSVVASIFTIGSTTTTTVPTTTPIMPSGSISSTKTSGPVLSAPSSRMMIDYIPKVLRFNRKKLVLDLDETLISASQRHQGRHDLSIRISVNGAPSTFFIKKRPHVDFFLETVSQWFELVVFTASLSTYANAVIDQLDPSRRIKQRYFRHNCINTGGGYYVKDLSIVCKDMRKIVIIDNSPIAYSKNRENAIPIPDFVGHAAEDQALLKLLPLLEEIRRSKDVRPVLRQRFTPQILNRNQGAVDLKAIEKTFYES